MSASGRNQTGASPFRMQDAQKGRLRSLRLES